MAKGPFSMQEYKRLAIQAESSISTLVTNVRVDFQ